jgi:hypothetical protein
MRVLGISLVKHTSAGPSAYDLVRSPLVKLRGHVVWENRLESRRGSLEQAIASSNNQWQVHGQERSQKSLRCSGAEFRDYVLRV